MRNGERTLRHLLGPIQTLLDTPEITEICINKPGEVGYERGGRWGWRTIRDFDLHRLDAIGLLAGSLLSKSFDPANPICMTTLPDGQRCTLCRPPVTPAGTVSITIRIPSQAVHTIHDADFNSLMRAATSHSSGHNAMDEELLTLYRAENWPSFFDLAVRARKTIAATGSTGSGKTSFIRRLMQHLPVEERVITIEDTPEFLTLPVRNRVSLFYGSANVTAEDLVQASLRMRPDRVALQELRGAEAFAYLRLLAAGHPGGMSSWHAEDGDPFTPLALMCKQHSAGKEIPDDKLDLILRGLIDIVAFCRRDENGFSVPSVYYRGAA